MKITGISSKKIELKLKKPIKIAFTTFTGAVTNIVRIETDDGLTGIGEANPPQVITGETPETVEAAVECFSAALAGMDPFNIVGIHAAMDSLMAGNTAAKAGVDIAVYDLCAKSAGLPLYRYLGGGSGCTETDYTVCIDAPEKMYLEAQRAVSAGFKTIKVKIGSDPTQDVLLVKNFRRILGPDICIRLDANQGYAVSGAARVLQSLEDCNIQLVEQPLKSWDEAGLAELRTKTDIPVYADESAHSPQDAYRLAAARAVDGINIKLMKCGGLYPALQIAHVAEAAGMGAMIGCMLESPVSITAAASFAASQRSVLYADLDSPLDLQPCPWAAGGARYEGGSLVCSDLPGLGIEILN
jgi:L-alanine-DL-glutamate epimerase-like enolase superfamily enzyme